MVFRIALLLVLSLPVCTAAAEPPDFAQEVLPILSARCFACHGPDTEVREAGLRLDVRKDAIRALDSGVAAIVPGSSDESELIQRVFTSDEFSQMPPPETGKSLTTQEKEILKRWVEDGAPYAEHWSFQTVQRPELPNVGGDDWPRNEIDHFVLARLQSAGMSPSPQASPQTLIRRLYLDLIGLPPPFEAVQRFVKDPSDQAYERIVDELLASEHFGERWGRHWLDLARYADSNGYLGDELRPDAWRYRDWVITAINNDLPYDEFTIEQIAGDLLDDSTMSQQIATGFHSNAMKNTEAGVDKEADRVIQTVDRLSTVGTIWLGLTVGCAECHTHKFDPITHQEFYQLYAFFNNLEPKKLVLGYRDGKSEKPAVIEKREQQLQKIANRIRHQEELLGPAQSALLDQFLVTLSKPTSRRTESEKEALEHWLADLQTDTNELLTEYESLTSQRPEPVEMIAQAMQESSKPRKTHIHYRGDFRQPTQRVYPATPQFLPPLEQRHEVADRLDLARWLVDPKHPLTSRTAANHLWQHLFQEGLFRTEENLGVAGDPPTHPELLDWLASELVKNDWSRKALIKQIVLSATYQQSSQMTDQLQKRDPDNLLLGRQFRCRLEGEIIRDLALSSSGLLNPKIGGPSIRPPMNKRLTSISRNQGWDVSKGDEQYRRGLYILFRRATPFPMLTTFDSPDSTSSCPSREFSNSPLQSLALLNDPVFFECAQQLGNLVSQPDLDQGDAWIQLAFQRTLSRSPSPDEMRLAQAFHADLLHSLEKSDTSALQAIVNQPVPKRSLQQQAARVLFVRSLMNLDEFITRE
ncbi:PSD1 and planctomycete cytochrome C domain-containing protein [Blastopirellula sp. J2-11]|uniref:PSD1 and planctomycete cytochrome C domain-containing protein n=1 Tax=Blastopirellula sp. J2-11 TaxID=2943192 RepID=UPI0021C84AF9|nr:PSD1 and planctomycete cytochrome C domain-containing protein [Blastopirellula sp. J2-11]UUO06435.1 PSD1 and planctomycete cytochrome C domain-containing protein [Blastopirellula sp. J2-11]